MKKGTFKKKSVGADTTHSRTYKLLVITIDWYWDEGVKFRNGKLGFERRKLRSWKNYRKHQWREN